MSSATQVPVDEPERATYRDVLGRPEFRALFLAHVASMTGDVVAAAALTVLVYQRTSSPLLASLTFSLVFAPHLLSGAVVAAVVDRLPARATLVACHVGSAVLVAAMALPGLPLPALFALLLGLGLLAPIFSGSAPLSCPTCCPAGHSTYWVAPCCAWLPKARRWAATRSPQPCSWSSNPPVLCSSTPPRSCCRR